MLLILGSLNVDLMFAVQALPRPGETVLCPGYQQAAGGKGANQAAAAAKAGANVRMFGQVGDDDFGRYARANLAAAGVDCAGVVQGDAATGIAVIGVDRAGENQIIVASGANLACHQDQVPDQLLAPGNTVLCQNEIPPAASFALLQRARRHGARTMLNLAPATALSAEVLTSLDLLLVNEIEAAAAAGAEPGSAPPAELARGLAARHGLTVVVTLGGAGALAIGADLAYQVAPLAIQPVDTTGAGDTFAGVLAASLDLGQPLPDALRRASVAAGLACLRLGAQTSQPSAAEIAARLDEVAIQTLPA